MDSLFAELGIDVPQEETKQEGKKKRKRNKKKTDGDPAKEEEKKEETPKPAEVEALPDDPDEKEAAIKNAINKRYKNKGKGESGDSLAEARAEAARRAKKNKAKKGKKNKKGYDF